MRSSKDMGLAGVSASLTRWEWAGEGGIVYNLQHISSVPKPLVLVLHMNAIHHVFTVGAVRAGTAKYLSKGLSWCPRPLVGWHGRITSVSCLASNGSPRKGMMLSVLSGHVIDTVSIKPPSATRVWWMPTEESAQLSRVVYFPGLSSKDLREAKCDVLWQKWKIKS